MDERRGPGFACYKPFFTTVRGRRFGFEYSRVGMARPGMREVPYLDRYIVYLGGLCVRLHKFWRGDDDRAPHDHPWNFWTFPLRSYNETVEELVISDDGAACEWRRRINKVTAFRLHKRPAAYRHIVLGRADGSTKPFWTFVITGRVINSWGFWPRPDDFVKWRDWT
jgi:hypothetical protein